MKFLATAALVGTFVSSVVAAPAELSRRTDSYECCKKSDGWHSSGDCGDATDSQKYVCSTVGLLNILNCVNVLNGNTVEIPINVVIGGLGSPLKARNDGGSYQCCNEGGSWRQGSDCSQENQYTCSSVGLLNLLNCVNVLNGNTVQIPINVVVGGLGLPIKARNNGGSYECCNEGGSWRQGNDCSQQNQYVCSSVGLVNVLNCVNVLNGNTVQVPINIIVGGLSLPLKARNGGGSYECCNEGGSWRQGSDCSQESQYVCSSVGLVNVLNCVNVLNGNTVQVPINIIVGGLSLPLKARTNSGEVECCNNGGSWSRGGDCSDENKYVCSTIGLLNVLNCVNVLNGNTVQVPINVVLRLKARSADLKTRSEYDVCREGDSWSRGSNCEDSNKYTCSTVGLLNVLNCVNILNGNTVQVPITVILRLKARNASIKTRNSGSEYNVCQSGTSYSWGSNCEEKSQYQCTTVGLLNILNCVNILNGNTIQVPITAVL